ncbi:endonuclease MutS2 [Desulfovibrio litoralis]|uniref:Endonuclease MutS2 n=1 Tax=Desulfovibrio litoralis DSM 11393 TaxID=1121455 RepID=A0A1M7S0B2_9BACT|nr:Smr/MutS family protein [Desulfovibrio litoralis]SHN51866.1 DNA mismatch repair protein MutS2 [Desulfovibrio litoralis DSM 11393]
MQKRAWELLEFNKVLKCLSSYAVSESGAKKALALEPFTDLIQINRESSLFEETRTWFVESGFKIQDFPSLDFLFKQLSIPHFCLELETVWALRIVLTQAAKALNLLKDPKTGEVHPLYPNLCALAFAFENPKQTLQAVQRCLSDDGTLKDEASPALSLVRGELRQLHQQCTRKVKEFANTYNIAQYLQDEFMTLSSDRYVLPLKTNFKGRVQGIIHDYSQTGETCYFEPFFLVEINNRLQELKREERSEERKVLLYISKLAQEESLGISAQFNFLVELDFLQAKCVLAAAFDGHALTIDQDASINLIEARHPLLALSIASKEGVGETPKTLSLNQKRSIVQPIDLTLNSDQRVLVVSGGNAGGKTVCLKTLGLIALMSHAGLPVPVKGSSSLPLLTAVHAFIGDEQSLEDSVSTFTAQIEHLAGIWNKLDASSLIILDEFGAGTDPAQGAALAQAVLDGILEQKSYGIVATHFPSLKAYALAQQGVRAASVLFDPNTKRPLFRLAYDQVGSSQALDVAKAHGLPESVLKKAEQYLLLSGEDSSALLERLNTVAVSKELEIETLKKEQLKLKERRAKLEDSFKKEKEALFNKIQEDAHKILHQWRDNKISHKQALKELAQARTTLANTDLSSANSASSKSVDNNRQFKVGQTVVYLPWDKKGELLELDTRKAKARLEINGVRLWVGLDQVAELGSSVSNIGIVNTAQPKTQSSTGISVNTEINFALTLDLRGKRADVAISELAQFIDSAIVSGRNELEIIHGRGTGALRKEVHLFLKTFPAVKSFNLANEDQGGDGKTIVVLR